MTIDRIAYGRIAPTIRVRNLQTARAFYADILGFETLFENGNPVRFVVLKKDEAEIHLAEDADHAASAINVAHMFADDVAALHRLCCGAGVPIVRPLTDKDYGQRAFVIADPDGNRIDIGERTSVMKDPDKD
jgi:catechol 2,3-dioxygenase-like lactoylglutathione lyase family enzyme